MTTIRDHIAQSPATPAPPSAATHVLCWEPGQRREATYWELAALDARPHDGTLSSGLPADAGDTELAGFASSALGCPVVLSPRFEVQGEAGCYVTPAGGGW